jgi:hypothetical protein
MFQEVVGINYNHFLSLQEELCMELTNSLEQGPP